MKEQLILLETAKLAKEKGFNLFSQGWYGTDNPVHGEPNKFHIRTYLTWDSIGEEDSQEGTEIYSAPTQSILQKWLRDIHNIKLYLLFYDDNITESRWSIFINKQYISGNKSFEDALEIGLLESLNLIKL